MIDQYQGNRTVVDVPTTAHSMSLQAAQVLVLASQRQQQGALSLTGMVQTELAALPTFNPAAAAILARQYWASAITGANTPDELAWRDFVAAADTANPGGSQAKLLAALTNGTDYRLSEVQAILLAGRLRADAYVAAIWARTHPNQKIDQPPSGAAAASAPAIGSAMPATSAPCALDPIPDWLYNGVAIAVSKAWEAIGKISSAQDGASIVIRNGVKIVVTNLDQVAKQVKMVGNATGIASLAGTVISLLLTKALFHASLVTNPAAPVRTKSAATDGDPFTVTATFTTGTSNLQWVNCLKLVLAIKGVTGGVPKSGPWAGMVADGHFPTATVTKWTGTPDPTHVSGRTDATGSVTFAATGVHQLHDLPSGVQPYTRQVPVTVSVNPESVATMADQIMTAVSDARRGNLAAWARHHRFLREEVCLGARDTWLLEYQDIHSDN